MFIVPFTSSGHWLMVLPCLLGFACSPQAWGLFAPPSDSLWVSVVGVFCLCFRLWCASGLALPLSSLGSSSRSLFVSDLVGFGGWSLPLVCLSGGLCTLFVSWQCCFSVLFLVTLLSGLGVHAYLAGLDASSSRSPSVLVLLVLADLDGSITIGDSSSALKSRLMACRKTLFNA